MSKDSGNQNKKQKGKMSPAGKVAYRVIIVCLICIFLISGYKVATTAFKYWKARDTFSGISEIALVDPTRFTGEIDWDALLGVDSNIQAWLYLKNTIINYPVAQGTDNDYYLYHLPNGEYNASGTLFVDYRCPRNFQGFNSIIYGHHMRDLSMFLILENYILEDDFYENHKQFELITPDEKYHLVIFSSYVAVDTDETYTYEFNSDAAKQAHIDMVKSRSQIVTDPVEVTVDDRIVTLSTCYRAGTPNRYVVIGKLVPWTAEEKAEALKAQKEIDDVLGR